MVCELLLLHYSNVASFVGVEQLWLVSCFDQSIITTIFVRVEQSWLVSCFNYITAIQQVLCM